MAARDGRPTLEGVYLRNGEEATLVLHATQAHGLHMVRERLDQRGRDAIKPGNVYVWEEQNQRQLSETCLERWTDGMRWGPSRGGADGFLKYNQKLEEGESGPPLIKRTYSALMRLGGVEAPRKCYIVAYSSTCPDIDARLACVEELAHLPRVVPPNWYIPWRAPRQRGKKKQGDQDRASRSTATPVAPSVDAPRAFHDYARGQHHPGHSEHPGGAFTETRYAYPPEQTRTQRASYAATMRELPAPSGDAPALSVYANAALPVAAPQPIHAGHQPLSLMDDEQRALLPGGGSAAVAGQGPGAYMPSNRGAVQSDGMGPLVSPSQYGGTYLDWDAPYTGEGTSWHYEYYTGSFALPIRDEPPHRALGASAMQACCKIPTAPDAMPLEPPHAAYRDHLDAAPTYGTAPTRYAPYAVSEGSNVHTTVDTAYTKHAGARRRAQWWPAYSESACAEYAHSYSNTFDGRPYEFPSGRTCTDNTYDYTHTTTF